MKILFISHRIPYPPNKGDKLRAYHILKHLSRMNEVSLVSFYDHKQDSQNITEINKICKSSFFIYLNPFIAKTRGLLYFIINKPITLGYFSSRKLQLKVDALLKTEEFEVIFVYSSSMARYVFGSKIRKIIDFVDCDSAKWEQYGKFAAFPLNIIYSKEAKLVRRMEIQAVRNFEHAIVATESEKNAFANFTDTARFSTLTNGTDASFLNSVKPASDKSIIFTGQMDYFANIDAVVYFCKEILPLIREECPDIKFYIVGRCPVLAVRRLAKIKGVTIAGEVNDIREYLKRCLVFVAPLRIAQGVQNKILEAMASGVPVVATSKTLSGLKVEPGKDILLADNPKDFAASVIRLLNDAPLRDQMSRDARKYIEENHNWESNLSVLDKIIKL